MIDIECIAENDVWSLIEAQIEQDRLITGHRPEYDIAAMRAYEEAFENERKRRRDLRRGTQDKGVGRCVNGSSSKVR